MSAPRFDVITLFPALVQSVAASGIAARALQRGLWDLQCWNPRDQTQDVHRTVDDRPFGGGPGMVMMAQPLAATVDLIQERRTHASRGVAPVVLLSPQGQRFDQDLAQQWASSDGFILVCGRYEGVDQRFIERRVDLELSIGDFVLSGGELAAMVMIDACVRLLPGALRDPESAQQDSFSGGRAGLLDCPHYTRPDDFEGLTVPEVLRSGHHAQIERWRREQSLQLTAQRRPDLLRQAFVQGLLGVADLRYLKARGFHAILEGYSSSV